MSIEELIQAGVVPGVAVPVVVPTQVDDVVPTQVDYAPLTDEQKQELEAEVIFDYSHISTGRMKAKRNASPDYAAAMERVSADDYTGCPIVAIADHSGNYLFSPNNKFVSPVAQPVEEPVIEQPIAAATEVVVPLAAVPADDEEEGDGWSKTPKGWRLTLDPGDGSGAEVFEGKTKREVNKKLRDSKIHATRELRRRNRERALAEDFDVSSLNLDHIPAPVNTAPLAPDELYTLTNELHDPATSRKAFKRLLEAEANDPSSALGARLRKSDEIAAYENGREVGRAWMNKHSDFYNDPESENIQTMFRFFVKHNLDVTEKNLDTVFNILRTKSVLLEAPTEEVETTPVVAAPAVVVAPARVAPPVVQAVPPARAAQSQPVQRVRPGSISTGMSPRQASVRPGATGTTPVGLTVEEYQRTPAAEIRRRYKTDPGFRSGVDKLMAEGKI